MTWIYVDTTLLDCCTTTIRGVAPEDSMGEPTDVFGSLYTYQTVFLVMSNLVLLFPAMKAFWEMDFVRAHVLLSAMLVSCSFHLCKTRSDSGGICFLPFCTLRTMDYSTSTTLLLSIVYAIFPIYRQHKGGNRDEENIESPRWYATSCMEASVLFLFWISVYQVFGITQCGSDQTIVFMAVALAIGFLPPAIYRLFLYVSGIRLLGLPFDVPDFSIGFVLAAIAISLFVVESFLNVSFYWITHSLWHVFAALATIFLLDCRSKRTSGLRTLVFCWNVEK